MKKYYNQLTILIVFLCCLSVFTGLAQTTVTKYYNGPTQEQDDCGFYCSLPGLTFDASEFPTGALITNVEVSITWQKTAGSCSNPNPGDPGNSETSFAVFAPFSIDNNTVEGRVELAPNGTWSGTTQGGPVTTVFNLTATEFPSGTPTSGVFKSIGDPIILEDCIGKSPVGTWALGAGDLSDNNNALCVYNYSVSITANVPPTAVCTDQIIEVFLDENGQATITPQDIDGGSSDAEGPVTLSLSKDTFDCSDVGLIPVTLTVTDFAGATDSCESKILVKDIIKPVVSCKDTTVTLDAIGSYYLTKDDLDNGSSDNCTVDNNLTYTFSPAWFYCSDVGVHTVTMTVEDENGNSSSCDATVTVNRGADLVLTNTEISDICFGVTANTGSIYLEWTGIVQEVIVTPDGGTATTYNLGLENEELTISGLEAGNYKLDINAICGQMVSTTVEIKQLEELAITNAEPIDICFGGFSSSGEINL
ncbi:DUF5011/hyalin repeat domain-containing protein, partial [Aestuariibaculum marinum]|uniref:hypothetical protein n=1 Tax=Aestuariibaculum marinum TaxID=2683592 RepID=UPI0019D527CC